MLTHRKDLFSLPNSVIRVIFDEDTVQPSTEPFDLFKEPERFRDLLVELNMAVRGGMVEHYEEIFQDIRTMVKSPTSFHKEGILDIPEDSRMFVIVYIQHKDGDRYTEVVQLFLDKGYAIYTLSTAKDAKLHTFMVNGELFDMGILAEEDRNKVIERFLGRDLGFNF